MRTTFRIDDDLMQRLRERAAQEQTSVSKLLNRLLRIGLWAKPPRRPPYREKTFSMGEPRVNLDKALGMAAEEEDQEIIRKLQMRK